MPDEGTPISPSQRPRCLPLDRIDERLADADCDVAGLAVDLGLPVTQVEAFATVRRTLLARRIPGGGTHLAAAEHVHRLRAAEQPRADRSARTRPETERCADDRAAR